VSILQSVSEEFADAFAAGNFRDRGRNPEQPAETTDISERITVVKDDTQSHAAGFEVFLNLCTFRYRMFSELCMAMYMH
jgi:hypothetical protein